MSKSALISIIDDDGAVREATKSLIRSLGYNAETFASAEEYLGSDRARDTSCLITDVQMPGMTGFDLQDRLNAEGVRTPIIFMSAFSEVRARAIESNSIGFLTKPLDVERLTECLNKAISG